MLDVHEVLVDMVGKERRNLENAVRRRKRAALALRKADDDIMVISGALAALEAIYRNLHPEEEEGVREREIVPPSTVARQMLSTLAGPVTFNEEEVTQ